MSFERDGEVLYLRLDEHTHAVLMQLLGEIRDEIARAKSAAPSDLSPHLKRLFPTAYHGNEQLDDEYRRLTHGDLAATHEAAVLDAIGLLEPGHTFTSNDLERFARAINAVRLVLGTVLDVSEDDDGNVDEDDPRAMQWHVYDYLGWLLNSTLEQLA